MNNCEKNRGNLILELIVVIFCFSVLFKISYPHIKSYKRFLFKRSVDSFIYDLKRCRDLSVISGYPYIIETERKTGNYILTTIEKGEIMKIKKTLPNSLYFKTSSNFLFKSSGVVNQGDTILIKSYESNFQVKVVVRPVTSYITYEVIR